MTPPRRAASLLRRLTDPHLVRRALAMGSPLADIDFGTVVMDEAEICTELTEAFSRGPYAAAAPEPHLRRLAGA